MTRFKIATYTLAGVLALAPGAFASVQKNDQVKKTEVTKTSQSTEVHSKKVVRTETQAELQKQAKISMRTARKIALRKSPGKIASSELEREHGKLIYSFDIKKNKGNIMEVNVDAITGKVINMHRESAKNEVAEKKQMRMEKKQH